MMTPSVSRSPRDSGSPPHPPASSSNTHARAPPPLTATFARILVIMDFSAPCTSVLPVGNQHWDMLPINVWRPNVISVFNGDILTTSATFGSAGDVTPQGMWSITAHSIPLPNHILTELIMGPILMMTISTPLWMTTEKVRYVEPGARVYEGGNVTISFLSHVFFLVSVTRHPYFRFAPLYEETNITYLLFCLVLPSLLFLFSIALFHRTVSLLSYLSCGNYVSPTFHVVLRPSA